MAEIRLQKFLSECSVASRRKSEELIREGKVWVNGKKASIGDKVDPKRDDVTVNGKKVTVVNTTNKEVFYRVIAGSYREKANAERVKTELESKGVTGVFLEAFTK